MKSYKVFMILVVLFILLAGCNKDDNIVITSLQMDEEINVGEEMAIELEIKDTRDSLEYSWLAERGEIIGNAKKVTYYAPQNIGEDEITLKISDPIGSEEIFSKSLSVIENKKEPEKDLVYEEESLDLLARAVMGEAEGEPYKGKVAVAAVILSRVESDQFPNTIHDVLYQKNQFTIVETERIYLTPNQDSILAAKDALSGTDPSQGALFFYNPKTARNMQFFNRLEKIIKIDNHVFATAKEE